MVNNNSSLLYPLMIIAAMAVILFSIVGIATMTGHLPAAFSEVQEGQATSRTNTAARPEEPKLLAAAARTAATHAPVARAAPCPDCGVVESITASEVKGQPSGVGMVAGGVTGGVIGNQIGGGSGRTIATIVGAAGGAYVGNEIEKNVKKTTVYRITVRMDDGTTRTLTQETPPGFGIGEKVRIVDGRLAARG
jgi:outer membrane lipoprotein SlyB